MRNGNLESRILLHSSDGLARMSEERGTLMNRKWRIAVLVGTTLVVGIVAFVLHSRDPVVSDEDIARNTRLMFSSQHAKSGMTPSEVATALESAPDERDPETGVERWHTRGHLGHTVTIYYENGRVTKIENRTWKSRPELSWWDNIRDRLGF